MKRLTPEQIIKKLQQADGYRTDGMTVPDAWHQLEISVVTYHQWRKKSRGMDLDQAKEVKRIEKGNSEQKKVVAELTLDNRLLKHIAEGNF